MSVSGRFSGDLGRCEDIVKFPRCALVATYCAAVAGSRSPLRYDGSRLCLLFWS